MRKWFIEQCGCPKCKGTGKQTISRAVKATHAQYVMKRVDIDCDLCKGTSFVSKESAFEYKLKVATT